MISDEILLTALFSPLSLLVARQIQPRECAARPLPIQVGTTITLLGLAGTFWIEMEASRTVLLLLVGLVPLLLRLPVSEWSRTLLRVGLMQVPFLACFVLLLAFATAFSTEPSRTLREGVSPDGRWEFRCPGDCDTNVSVAPRGLSTWDPRAYPSRVMAYFGSGAAPDRIAWTGAREITTTWDRGGSKSERTQDGLGFRVVIREAGRKVTPVGTPSRAASRRPR